MSVFQTANGRWRVQLRRKGLPKLDAIFETEQEALLAQNSALGQASPANELTLAAAIEIYKKSSRFLDKKKSNKSRQLVAFRALEPLHGYAVTHLIDNPIILSDYRDKRRETVSADTVRIEFATLSGVFKVLAERRQISEAQNPCRGIYRGGHAVRAVRLSGRDEAAMYKAAHNQKLSFNESESIRFLLLLRTTGMRPGELASLPLSAIDLNTGYISIFDAKTGTRHVRILTECRDYLIAQLSAMPPTNVNLFQSVSSKTGQVIPYNYATRIKTLKQAGILSSAFITHAVRKEYVSRELENGSAFADIAVQTGHRNLISLEPYRVLAKTIPPAQIERLESQAAVRYEQSITNMLSKLTREELENYLDTLPK
jgi:integrase